MPTVALSSNADRPNVMTILGIDVGATSTRIALLDEQGAIQSHRRVFTSKISDQVAWTDWLIREVGSLLVSRNTAGKQPVTVGLALPGLIDTDEGFIQRSVNLPLLENFPIASVVAKGLGCNCFLMTDAQAATWGEYRAIESADAPDRFVHLRFGTGIAFGFVMDGVLQQIAPGRTQHLDFLVFDDSPDATICKCGLNGCLETIASGAAISLLVSQANLGASIDDLRIAYEHDTSSAVDIVKRIQQAIETVWDNIVTQLSPNVATIGGGVVERFPALFDQLLNRYQAAPASASKPADNRQERPNTSEPRALIRAVIPHETIAPRELSSSTPIVTKGVCGDWAGAIGAGLLARNLQAQRPS